MNNLHVKTSDTVIVLSGKDKGKKGKVLACDPKKQTIIVEGINMATLHKSAQKVGPNAQSGIIKKEIPIRACKVMLVCPKCNAPTRVAHKILQDGSKAKLCKKCNETM